MNNNNYYTMNFMQGQGLAYLFEIQDHLTSVNRNSWGGDHESLGQIDMPITLETSHYLFIIL